MRRVALLWGVVLAAGLAAACGGMSAGGAGVGSSVLTSQEIRELQGDYDDMLELIRNERSLWLDTRGLPSVESAEARHPTVYVDGARRSTRLEALEGLDPRNVEEAEFLTASDATTRYGTGHPRGVIVIRTRGGG